MKNAAILFIVVLFVASCGKKKLCAGCGLGTVLQGEITAIVKDTVSIGSVFKLFDSLSLQLDRVNGFSYTSAFPSDSITAVKSYLQARPYIDSTTTVKVTWPTTLYISCAFHNMNIANQQDWLALMTQLKLTDNNDTMKMLHIIVPTGKEQTWVDTLNGCSIVKKAGLIILAP